MIKRVNILTNRPIIALNVPIRGDVFNINMDVQEIFKCICAKARVEEILKNGTILPLSLSNYNKDNNIVVPVEETAEEEISHVEGKVIDNMTTQDHSATIEPREVTETLESVEPPAGTEVIGDVAPEDLTPVEDIIEDVIEDTTEEATATVVEETTEEETSPKTNNGSKKRRR